MLRAFPIVCFVAATAISTALAQPCTPAALPGTPQNVVATDGQSCLFTRVGWAPVAGAGPISYRLWRAFEGDLESAEMIADGFSGAEFFDQDAVPLAPYLYWVQSVSPTGCVSELSSADLGFCAPPRPQLLSQPIDAHVNTGEEITLSVTAWFANHVQWRKDGVPLVDDGNIIGSQTATLRILSAAIEDTGSYAVLVQNECGATDTNEALLSVGDMVACLFCPADYDRDGGVTLYDLQLYFEDWSNATPCSDVNRDGGIDGEDVGSFVAAWEAGGC